MKEGRKEARTKRGEVVRKERRKREWWVPFHTIGVYMSSILLQQIKKDIKSGKTRRKEGRKEGSKDKKGGGRKKGRKVGISGKEGTEECAHRGLQAGLGLQVGLYDAFNFDEGEKEEILTRGRTDRQSRETATTEGIRR